ncbi:MAG TPA: SLATT domain-containing protein [Gaiellaceae bacterium]|jgi:hypothetical protein|nr:SLATT domain-containing protein [Gaiellaceae bacterium]
MARSDPDPHPNHVDEGDSSSSPWTPGVLDLLRDWSARAGASAARHYSSADRLSRGNLMLGIPVVVLTTFIGTSVFATLQDEIDTSLKILVGVISVTAAVLASLQTFLRFGERAEKHRVAGESWAALRREIDEMLALHPTYLAARGDPKSYLDDLRKRMDDTAALSPALGDRQYDLLSEELRQTTEAGEPARTSPTV